MIFNLRRGQARRSILKHRSAIIALGILLSMAGTIGQHIIAEAAQDNSVVKVLLGPKRTPFCMPSQYVSGVGQLTDGTWRMEVTMFLPDFLSEAVFDKLYSITPSQIFQSPERIRYENSIMSIEVKSSYIGANDPTGEISQRQGIKNAEQFYVQSANYPVKGFTEYDDKWGEPTFYASDDQDPYEISCFRDSCIITEILNHDFLVEISLNKPAIPKSKSIIGKINSIIKSTNCTP